MCSSEYSDAATACINNVEREIIERKGSAISSSSGSESNHQPVLEKMSAALSVSPLNIVSPCTSLRSVHQQPIDDDVASVDAIGRIFETQSVAIEKWLREKAPPDVVAKLHCITDELKENAISPKRPSVTSELFNQWMASSPKKVSVFFSIYIFFSCLNIHWNKHYLVFLQCLNITLESQTGIWVINIIVSLKVYTYKRTCF